MYCTRAVVGRTTSARFRFEIRRKGGRQLHETSSRVSRGSVVSQAGAARPLGLQEVAIHQGDHRKFDFLRTDGFAFADIGATAEDFALSLRHHRDDALLALRLTLREQTEVG